MNSPIRSISLSLLLITMLGLAGCAARDRHYEGKDYDEARPGPVKPGPEESPAPPPVNQNEQKPRDPHMVKPETRPLSPRLSDVEKQDIGRKALFDLQRMIISSEERMDLSDGVERTNVARDVLATKLEELTYNVVATTSELGYSPSESEQNRFREMNNCNLAFLLKGEAEQFDKFGDFYAYKAEVKGKLLNLTTHQEIASKTVRKKGRRALDESEAARDALESAAADMSTYLTDEASRKWEATSLISLRLICTDLGHVQEVDDVRIGLQRRPGIYYVSLEHWDKQSDTAVYEILCRYDVREYLVDYVDELRIGRIQVEHVERGRIIKADQDLYD